MIRIETEQADYPPLLFIRVFDGAELLYRRLIAKTQEAEIREELVARFVQVSTS